MLKQTLRLTSAIIAFAAFAANAQATVTFTLGNNPQTDENVLLSTGLSGATIFGTLNQSGASVSFSSTIDLLSAPSNGQARVEETDALLNEVTVAMPDHSFASLIFNAFDGDGTAFITAIANEPGGGTSQALFQYELGNGSNFLTITTADGETLQSVKITSVEGFTDLRQIRIGGAARTTGVPDGGSTLLLSSLAFGALGLAFRRSGRAS